MTEVGDCNYDNHENVISGTYTRTDVNAGELGEIITIEQTWCQSCNAVLEEKEVSREPIIPE